MPGRANRKVLRRLRNLEGERTSNLRRMEPHVEYMWNTFPSRGPTQTKLLDCVQCVVVECMLGITIRPLMEERKMKRLLL